MTSYPAPVGYAPYYSWIGAPTSFNGTNPLTGGDSCKINSHNPQSTTSEKIPQQQATSRISANNSFSCGESESMVRPRRPSIHYRSFGYGRGHDTRTGISVFGIGTAKVCLDDDMGLHGFFLRHYLSMVPVGLFTGILGTRDERVHWRSQSLWFNQHPWCSQPWLPLDSGIAV